jgi:hypothetical protein
MKNEKIDFNQALNFVRAELALETGVEYNKYQSSAIRRLQRIPGKHGGLLVTFQSGSTWLYFGVSNTTAVEMYNSESLGKAYHQLIKGNYRSQKMMTA